jgi:hypothetical protein
MKPSKNAVKPKVSGPQATYSEDANAAALP